MKKVIFIAAALCALAACNKEVISAPEAGNGVLMLSVDSSDDVKVTTKATVPTTDFNVTVVNDEDATVKQGKPGELAVVVLPADNYVVKAENITVANALSNNNGKGQLRLAGETAQFALAQSETKTVTVNCVATNSKITVTYDASFENAFKTMNVDLDQIAGGNRDFTSITESAEYFYNITEGAKVDVKLTATSKAEVPVSHTQNIDLSVGYHYAVTYSATTDGQLKVTVTADDALVSSNHNIPVNPYQPAA